MSATAIEQDIWIKATPEHVWNTLTDPEKISTWFAPGTIFRSTGTEPGAKLYIEDPATGAEMFVQILEVYDPPHRLVMRSQEPPESPFTTTYTLTEENGGTRLKLVYAGYEALPDEVRQPMMDENRAGFAMMLENIKALLEGKPLVRPDGF